MSTKPTIIRKPQTYICGHCACGRHGRCPRIIPSGCNVDHEATRCQCTSREHYGESALFQ